MTPRFSRRTLFGIAAAGTAAAAAGASLREMRACRTRKSVTAASDLTIADYVDREGWILTPADEKSLDSPQRPTRP
jgi:hypothetical protein